MAGQQSTSLELIIKAVDNASKTLKDVQAQLAGLTKGVGDLGTKVDENNKKLVAFKVNLEGVAKGAKAVAAFTAFGIGLKKIADLMIAAEKETARLDLALTNIGKKSGIEIEQALQVVSRVSGATIYSSGAVKQSIEKLVVAGVVTKDTINDTVTVLADLAAKMETSLPSAAQTLSRALQYPANATRLLRSAGIKLTEADQARVRMLVDMNRLEEARAIILQRVKEKTEGYATAVTKTLGGALQQLENVWEGLFEGNAGETDLLAGSTKAINDLTEALKDPDVKRGLDSLLTVLVKIGEALLNISTTSALGWKVIFDSAAIALRGGKLEAFDQRDPLVEARRNFARAQALVEQGRGSERFYGDFKVDLAPDEALRKALPAGDPRASQMGMQQGAATGKTAIEIRDFYLQLVKDMQEFAAAKDNAAAEAAALAAEADSGNYFLAIDRFYAQFGNEIEKIRAQRKARLDSLRQFMDAEGADLDPALVGTAKGNIEREYQTALDSYITSVINGFDKIESSFRSIDAQSKDLGRQLENIIVEERVPPERAQRMRDMLQQRLDDDYRSVVINALGEIQPTAAGLESINRKLRDQLANIRTLQSRGAIDPGRAAELEGSAVEQAQREIQRYVGGVLAAINPAKAVENSIAEVDRGIAESISKLAELGVDPAQLEAYKAEAERVGKEEKRKILEAYTEGMLQDLLSDPSIDFDRQGQAFKDAGLSAVRRVQLEYENALAELAAQQQKFAGTAFALSDEEYNRRKARIEDASRRDQRAAAIDDLSELAKEFVQYNEQAYAGIRNSIQQFVFDPFNEGLRGLARGIVDTFRQTLAQIIADFATKKLLGVLDTAGQSSGGFLSGLFNSGAQAVGNIFGSPGGNAGGGIVTGSSGIRSVGEEGPEMLVPNAINSMRILNERQLAFNASAGGQPSVNYAPTTVFNVTGDVDQKTKGEILAYIDQTRRADQRALMDTLYNNGFGRMR